METNINSELCYKNTQECLHSQLPPPGSCHHGTKDFNQSAHSYPAQTIGVPHSYPAQTIGVRRTLARKCSVISLHFLRNVNTMSDSEKQLQQSRPVFSFKRGKRKLAARPRFRQPQQNSSDGNFKIEDIRSKTSYVSRSRSRSTYTGDVLLSALFRLFPSASLLVAHLGLNPDPNPNPNP